MQLGLFSVPMQLRLFAPECPLSEEERRRRRAQQAHMRVFHRSVTTEWATPQAFFDTLNAEFGFTLDVAAQPDNAKCAHYWTPTEDGLAQPWMGVCWMNPPYGRDIEPWIRKAYESAQAGATVVCLLPVRTGTRWWQTWIIPYAQIRFLAGRLTFGAARHPAPFDNAVVIFRPP